MLKSLVPAIFGTAVIFAGVTVSANAADDIESKVQLCSACHGQNGEPTDPKTIPIIWGQQGNYLFKELHDFRSGDRDSPIMAPIAKGYSFEDLRAIAAYFAAKTWPASHASGAAPSAPEGSAMCRACHGQNFEGGAPAPRLAGLSYDYLIGAMNAFADGHRTNNLDMPGFMKALTQSQREAIAHYLSAL
jgi:cytochrome c553